MKVAAAKGAALQFHVGGDFFIQPGQSSVEGGIAKQSLVQSSRLRCFGEQRRQKNPLGKLLSSFPRGFLLFPHSA